VREEFFRISQARGGTLNLLITGGSQGSRTLNRAARESWPLFRKAGLPVRIVHQSGARRLRANCATSSPKAGLEGEVVPFIADMPAAFAAADLVVCRSGAGAVSELAAAGKPSILVPFPFAADDHQTRNAEAHGARRRGPAGPRRPDEREKLVRRWWRSWRVRRGRWSGWERRRGGSPGPARRGGRRKSWRRRRAQAEISIDSCAVSRNNT
jgi:UDP-N-acetylglucosamine transferase subunit ALG13